MCGSVVTLHAGNLRRAFGARGSPAGVRGCGGAHLLRAADARERQVVARGVLSGLEIIGHPSAYFLWLPMPEETRADQVAAALLREGISVSTAEAFATSKDSPHAIRIALGSVPIDVLRDALDKVKHTVEAHSYL